MRHWRLTAYTKRVVSDEGKVLSEWPEKTVAYCYSDIEPPFKRWGYDECEPVADKHSIGISNEERQDLVRNTAPKYLLGITKMQWEALWDVVADNRDANPRQTFVEIVQKFGWTKLFLELRRMTYELGGARGDQKHNQNERPIHVLGIAPNDYVLWGFNLRSVSPGATTCKFLMMRHPETRELIVEPVHPDCWEVEEAINWRTFGNRTKRWEPEVLT